MNPEQLTLESVIRRNDAIISSTLETEVVMMDIDQGQYYAVEKVAARIWEILEQPVAMGALCDRLAVEFDVPIDRCRAELMTFIGELLEQRIVQVGTPE